MDKFSNETFNYLYDYQFWVPIFLKVVDVYDEIKNKHGISNNRMNDVIKQVGGENVLHVR